MNPFHNLPLKCSTADVWLIRCHDKQITGSLQLRAGHGNIREHLEFRQARRRIWLGVTLQRTIDYTVAVKKNGANLYVVLSHLVCVTLSLGWDTNKCQRTP